MSDAKVPKKAETSSKKAESPKAEAPKTEAPKTEAPKTEASKAETPSSENTPVDKSDKKADTSPKSASQASISHFSSVSTSEYRSGWNKIFGGGQDAKKSKINKSDSPKHFVISDEDIGLDLRNVLNETFRLLAQKQGVDLSGSKSPAIFEYSIDCTLRKNKH